MSVLCEDYAVAAIMRDLMRRSFCMPRYTPIDWWECDVMELTESGYFREYEVKLSVADFWADAKKKQEIHQRPMGTPPLVQNKHEQLAAGSTKGPTEFSFVAPIGIITRTDLPLWAGLIELHDRGDGWRPADRWRCETVVKAPRIHRAKANPAIRGHALSSCYYRFHEALRANQNRRRIELSADQTAPEIQSEPITQ